MRPALTAPRARGFTLVELMVGLALGMLLVAVMLTIFIAGRGSATRLEQIDLLQESLRGALGFVSQDIREAGNLGCFTGRSADLSNDLPTGTLASQFTVAVEGFDHVVGSAGTFTMSARLPAMSTTASDWQAAAAAAGGLTTLPMAQIAAAGLAPGSDVLVLRGPAANPARLAAATLPLVPTLTVNGTPAATCADGSLQVAGFCAGTPGVLSACNRARLFAPTAVAGNVLVLGAPMGSAVYQPATSELIPLQTTVYYVRTAGSGNALALYRRTLSGPRNEEEELVEGVENLQLIFGEDTTAPDADGQVDRWVRAHEVGSWNRVVAVRVSVLLSSLTPVPPDLPMPAQGRVGDVDVVYPTGTPAFDRRVFTTTVALRNRISY